MGIESDDTREPRTPAEALRWAAWRAYGEAAVSIEQAQRIERRGDPADDAWAWAAAEQDLGDAFAAAAALLEALEPKAAELTEGERTLSLREWRARG